MTQRRPDAEKALWTADLLKALNRREGELAYQKGALAPSTKALKAAFAAEPLNPIVANNLACVQYRQGQRPGALTTWQGLEASLPEAALNLGIDAQEIRKDYPKALEEYRRYVTLNGARSVVVKEWIERLDSLYGTAEGSAAVESREGTK